MRSDILRVAFALALLSVLSCDGDFFGSAQLRDLRDAHARWQASDIDSYEINVEQLCFCPDRGPVRVRVESGVIVSRVYVRTGNPVSTEGASSYPDIPGLFAVVGRALREADELTTEFDATYGFPRLIGIDWMEDALDDEMAYRADEFAPLP